MKTTHKKSSSVIKSATKSLGAIAKSKISAAVLKNRSANINADSDSEEDVFGSSDGEYSKDRQNNFAQRVVAKLSTNSLAFRRSAAIQRGNAGGAQVPTSSSSSSGSGFGKSIWSDSGAFAASSLYGGGYDGGGGNNGGDSGNVPGAGISEVISSAEKAAMNDGREKGDDISDGGHFTAVNSANAYQSSWMRGDIGNNGSNFMKNEVEGTKTLGEAVLTANNKQFARHHMTTAGEAVSKDVGTAANPVKAVLGIIDSTHGRHGRWFMKDFDNAVAIGRASHMREGATTQRTNDPNKFRAALRTEALRNAAEGGGGTLIVTSAAHGFSDRAGNDNVSAQSGFQVGGQTYREAQYEADIAAAKVLGGYDNVIALNNPCFCGGFDGVDDTGQVNDIARPNLDPKPGLDNLDTDKTKLA